MKRCLFFVVFVRCLWLCVDIALFCLVVCSICCLLSGVVAYCALFIARRVLSITLYMVFVVRCLPLTVCYLLFVVCCLWWIVHCVLCVFFFRLLIVMDGLPFILILFVVGSGCVLFAVRSALCAFVCGVRYVLLIGRCVLFSIRCDVFVVCGRCALFVVCGVCHCVSFVGCCLLCVACFDCS